MYALRIVSVACYPHMPIGKVLIYRLLFVCLFVFMVTNFSADDKASRVEILHGGSSASRAGNLPFFVNFAHPKAQNWPARGPRTPLQYIARSRIGMCGYRPVPADVLVGILVDTD